MSLITTVKNLIIASAVLVLIVPAQASLAAPAEPGDAQVLLEAANKVRTEQGLKPLVLSSLLASSSAMKSQDMASKQYFAHTSPEGLSPWHWFYKAGYKPERSGENLAMVASDITKVTPAWVKSPSHYKNLVNKDFVEVGFSVVKGQYKGKDVLYVTAHFGKRLK
jgi:uncharacterized protein YkwD